MTSAAIELGPFTLQEPIATGGMATVWRAVHREQQVSVAVKVLLGQLADDPKFIDSLRNEVRAVAALDHPHIVWLYDQGEVSDEAAVRSGNRLVAGTPWLAMEYCEGGTLRTRSANLDWPTLRELLLDLLDALAHAHARGVIHRDIKPSNLLIGGLRPGVKLTDFGLVFAWERDPARDGVFLGGTLAYMAPEQVIQRLSHQGPWTDLYALGCVAYHLVSGRRPFGSGRENKREVLEAHLRAAAPPLTPRFRVPAGLEAWIARLMAKDPNRRFRWAADAAWALLRLDGGAEYGPPPAGWTPPDDLAEEPDTTLPVAHQRTTLVFDDEAALSDLRALDRSPAEGPNHVVRPPLPLWWRRPEKPPRLPQLLGAGLGLFGLRTFPMVDRESERDVLWDLLKALHADGRPRALVLDGASGCGKSRLAGWLSRRAHEVGAAATFRATHGPDAAAGDGLAGMVARHLRVGHLPRAELVSLLSHLLRADGVEDEDEWLALAELVHPADEADLVAGARPVRFGAPLERHLLVRRVLARAATRPLVVWLDDVQWGEDAIRFAERELTVTEDALPILFLLTVDSDLLQSGPAADALQALQRRPATQRMEVRPVPEGHRRELVRALLGFEPALAARIEERSAGNPLFAIQLVGDWVQRGLLEEGRRGFRLVEGGGFELPHTLSEVWATRVARLLADRDPQDGIALELAAALGHEVQVAEWRELCRQIDVAPPGGLVSAMLRQQLARVGDDVPITTWSFAHAMLREAIVDRARKAGRWASHHRAAASMLATRRPRHGVAARVGRHLIAAGDAEGALEPLLQGAEELDRVGDHRAAEVLLIERDDAMRAAALPGSDVRWGEGWVTHAQVLRVLGRTGEALEWSRKALQEARTHGWRRVEAHALQLLGGLGLLRGDLGASRHQLEKARSLAATLDDHDLMALLARDLGVLHLHQGRAADAERLFEEGLEHSEQASDLGAALVNWLGLAEAANQAGRYAQATEHVSRARACARAIGSRDGAARGMATLGDTLRWSGNLARAETCYRRAWQLEQSIGGTGAALARGRLGLCLLEEGRVDQARAHLDETLARTAGLDWRPMQAALRLGLLACAADQPEQDVWDTHLAAATGLVDESGWIDRDLARLADLAARRAAGAGYPDRARAAWRVAHAQLVALGRTADASAIEAAVIGMGSG